MSLIAEQVTFQYQGEKEPVFSNVSVSIAKGEIAALTGPNGSGKSTLAKLLTGILKPQSGEILLDGESIAPMTLAQIGKKIGFVMQNPNQQLFCTSVREEVAYGLHNLGMQDDEIASRADALLTFFDLKRYEDKLPFLLSTGEKQRLVLAAVLAMRPPYLILDEPTASIDLPRRRQLGEYLQQIKKERGCGILLISHDERFASTYAEVALSMSGKKRGEAS